MAKKYKKLKNPEFTIFVENMLNRAADNKIVLEFDPTKVAELGADNDEMKIKLLSIKNLQDTLDSEIQSLRALRGKMNGSVEYFEIDADNNEKVTDSLMELMGFDVNGQSSGSSGVSIPVDLLVKGTSDGINHLKWKRNGNRHGTTFMIETKIGDAETWSIIDAVTSTKYEHKNQTPGVRIQYRVRAKRSESVSTPSNTAIVYE